MRIILPISVLVAAVLRLTRRGLKATTGVDTAKTARSALVDVASMLLGPIRDGSKGMLVASKPFSASVGVVRVRSGFPVRILTSTLVRWMACPLNVSIARNAIALHLIGQSFAPTGITGGKLT